MPRMTDTPKTHNANTAQKGASVVGKRKTDWEAVERDYRTGKYTLRELETKHGADHGLISRKARKEEWKQDLGPAIKQATSAKLVEQLVTNEVTNSHQKVTNTIDVAATMSANVILGHRKGLKRITGIKEQLLTQIEQTASEMPAIANVLELLRKPDENGIDRANDALKKMLGRSALVDDLKKLADVDEKVRKGEREAFDLDEPQDDKSAERDVSRYTDAERAVKLAYLMSKVSP